MKHSDARRLATFFELAGQLKKERRKGWVLKAHIPNPESVADHVFRVALAAMLLGDLRKLDTYKILKMAILHDLGEAITGDLIPEEKRGVKDEREALDEVLSLLPEALRREYSKVWVEFSRQKSSESKLVKQADKFEMALQALGYAKELQGSKGLTELFRSAKRSVKDKVLLNVLEAYSETAEQLSRKT